MRKPWTDSEVQFLRDHYPSKGAPWVAEQLKRSQASVEEKTGRRGLNLMSDHNWSPKQDALISSNYPNKGAQWVADELGRSKGAISCRAERLGVRCDKYWTITQIQYLVDSYGKIPTQDIADALGMDVKRVRYQIENKGLTHKAWSSRNLAVLRNNFGVLSYREIGRRVCKSKSAVFQMALKVGLCRKGKNLSTVPELRIKNTLKVLGIPFEEQVRIRTGKFGKGKWYYWADFMVGSTHVIEVHGDYWHTLPDVKVRDQEKRILYTSLGFALLEVWEHQTDDTAKLIKIISNFLAAPSSNQGVHTA